MTKVLLLAWLLPLSFSGCFCLSEEEPANELPRGVKSEVQTVMDRFSQSLLSSDVDQVSSLFVQGSNNVYSDIFTGERVVGWEAFRVVLERGLEDVEIRTIRVNDQIIEVGALGRVAWVTGSLDFSLLKQGRKEKLQGMRFTTVLQKQNSEWLITHLHLSPATSKSRGE